MNVKKGPEDSKTDALREPPREKLTLTDTLKTSGELWTNLSLRPAEERGVLTHLLYRLLTLLVLTGKPTRTTPIQSTSTNQRS